MSEQESEQRAEALALTAGELRELADLADILGKLGIEDGRLRDDFGNEIEVMALEGRIYLTVGDKPHAPTTDPASVPGRDGSEES